MTTTHVQRLAAYFLLRPNQWVSALELVEIGGRLSWRTRLSDLRKPPFGMVIESDVSEVRRRPGGGYERISKYRYVVKNHRDEWSA